MLINHKKPSPSLNQGISRSSPSPFPLILKYSFLSCSSSNFHAWYWYYSNSRYLFLQSITPQVRFDIRLLTEIDNISVFWSSVESSPYPNRRWYQKTHLLCSSTTFNLLKDIIKLLLFNHYPYFAISMSYIQSGAESSTSIGTCNIVEGGQDNTTIESKYFILLILVL